ncbi:MAG TPA: NUDIX domain-containing protein [Pseudolabrys sp.]|jgi:8-oxo-dGTP diphosphatase
MKTRWVKSFASPIMAAGGIVVAPGKTPLVAIVQRRKDDRWVLPKGKLKSRESALAAAQREVREETGHRVAVQDYLGVVSYDTSDGPKIVQFWRMRSLGSADHRLMRDIKAVKWLPFEAAVARLNLPVERAFLAHIGEDSLRLTRQRSSRRPTKLQTEARPTVGARKGPVSEQPRRKIRPTPDTLATKSMFRRLFSRLQVSKHASKADTPLC